MELVFDAAGTTDSLRQALTDLISQPHVHSILILACDANGYTRENLKPVMQVQSKPCFGGIFPQVIYKSHTYDKGTILIGLSYKAETAVIENLGDESQNLDELMLNAFSDQHDDNTTMFVFVDGLSSGIGRLMDSLFDQFGFEINYLGGGAGSLSLKQCPCVISNRDLHQDSAILATIPKKSGVGVSHGWEPVSEALKVTESEGNSIISLDWKPAFQEYRKIVEPHSKLSFDNTAFFDIAKAYPFGIAKLDAEMVIRDPLMHEADALVCVGEVPQGAYVHVMHGDTESLISAASDALSQAEDDFIGQTAEVMVFIDCISRALFLNDDYQREVQAVEKEGLPTIGALTLGEIANNGLDYLEFYNKTSVVGLLPN